MIARRQIGLGLVFGIGVLTPSWSDPVNASSVSRPGASARGRQHEPINAIPQTSGLNSGKTLEDAVKIAAKYELGPTLSPVDVDQIVNFLHTLTGEYEGRRL